MPDLWVSSSGDKQIPPELEAERQRLEAERAAIAGAGDEDACRVCGSIKALTEEHTPSRKAGNPPRIFRASIDYERTVERGALEWRTELVQGGATANTLCGKCNNMTGRLYNPAYIRLVRRCEPFAIPDNVRRTLEVLVTHPQRVAKQALTTLLATMESGVTGRYPQLRLLLLDAEAQGAISPLRLSLFIRPNKGGRPTGIGIQMNLDGRPGRLIAEFSFWPLGWILTFDDRPVEGTVDVSDWTKYGYHDQANLTIGIPCQWALWAYAADFREPEEFMPPVVRDFYQKHRGHGDFSGGIEGEAAWFGCVCGARIETPLKS